MVSGEIYLEDIKDVKSTRYEWSNDNITEEIIVNFNDGRLLAISGSEGFFNKISMSIINKDTFISELGKVTDGE